MPNTAQSMTEAKGIKTEVMDGVTGDWLCDRQVMVLIGLQTEQRRRDLR